MHYTIKVQFKQLKCIFPFAIMVYVIIRRANMSGNSNKEINAAYVASWKEKNPKLLELETDGKYLKYKNEKLDISNIYMQDVLINPNTFNDIPYMEVQDLFMIIKLHVYAIHVKEKQLQEKVRRLKEYEPRSIG